jgi:predicted regulator of Ras-like GTPase activity (Roadblock/LC7/MglB family)
MSNHPSVGKKAHEYIEEIRSVFGVLACALVSQDGIVMGKFFQEDNLSSSLFAAMSATVLASAEAAANSVHIQPPTSVLIIAPDATILVMSAGEAALITAVIEKSADLPTVQKELSAIASKIEGEV